MRPGSSSLEDNFWSGKRVLITGHSGFKGAWLAFWLSRLGADVTGFALSPRDESNLFDALDIRSKVVSHFGDIRDMKKFLEVVHAARPEIFFHLAGQAHVRDGYTQPVETYDTNVMGTVHALEGAREIGELRALVVVTSDKCYRNDNRLGGYREDDPLGGDDPYSCSKACAELVVASYRKCFFEAGDCALATVRAGNVIGGGDWSPDRLVPDVVRALVGKSPLTLRNPAATRPWQHVLDALSGYMMLAERLWRDGHRFADAWNFGPESDQSASVADVVNSMFALWEEKAAWSRDEASNPPESQRLGLDAAKAREQLGWKPRLSTAQAIGWTVEWYRAWHSGEPVERVTARQLECYQDCVGAY